MSASPLPPFLSPVTIPASWLYRSVIELRNRHFNRKPGERVRVPVISIGNITTGGVGKTPMVMWVARVMREAGYRPAICMRGYGATRTQLSDEQMEYTERISDVPVVADADRVTASRQFLADHPDTDVLLVDDGFQHRRLHRDLDLVLIDATQRTFTDRLLPAGHLREPLHGLRRADAVIITRAPSINHQLSRFVETFHGRQPLAWTQHIWEELRLVSANATTEVPVAWLAGKNVTTMFGIGNPEAMNSQLIAAGATVSASIPARDHEQFTPAKLANACDVASGSDALVVTSKDWVKLRDLLNLQDWPVPIIVPQLTIDVYEGRETLESLVLSVVAKHRSASRGE